MVALSFDGAAVMIGRANSVASRWLDLAPQAKVFHALAHRLESAFVDACKEVPYLSFVGELCQDLYALLNSSMKQDNQLKEMAAYLNIQMVSLTPLHGIRWLASQERAVRGVLRLFVPLCVHLQKVALNKVGCLLLTSSPSDSFLNVKITLLVGDAKKTARVVRVVPAEDGKSHLEDKFICKLDRSTAQRTLDEYTLTKDEVVFRIADSKEAELKLIK
jgi:hypothetical protein